MLDWVKIENFDDRPTYGPPCPGYKTHPWRLTVYEGRASVSSGCAECDESVMGPAGGEDLIMDVEVTGTLLSRLEVYHPYGASPEYDHWWEFVPDVETETASPEPFAREAEE